jgi:hypothetical protein
MITCYFFVDPSVNPDLFNPIQLPDFVSDLFGIHNTFPPFISASPVNQTAQCFAELAINTPEEDNSSAKI